MRIAIVTSVYYPMINGVAVFSHNLAVGLARRGQDVMVITPSQTKKYHVETEDGVRVVYLKSQELKLYPDQIHPVSTSEKRFYKHGLKVSVLPWKQIKKAFDSFHPEVIHVQGSDPVGVMAVRYAKKYGIPVVMTEHNQAEVLTEPLKLPRVIRKPANKALACYFKRRLKKGDYITMPTERAMRSLFSGEKIQVPMEAVSNGVDLALFKPGKPDPEIYHKYEIPPNIPIVLYVGRVDPEKRIGLVIEAFSQFLNKHRLDSLSKTLFLVVGDGVDKNNLQALVRSLKLEKSVKFLGRITPPELYNIYRVGDIFVTASEIETQGIVLIEAAATGLPLVAARAGAVSEVCQNERNGFLIEPGNVKMMSEAIAKLMENTELRTRMSHESIEIANAHSLERTIDKFLQIYDKLIKRVQK